MPSIDFDPRNSDLRVGIEVEYPIKDPEDELYVDRGNSSNTLQNNIDRWPSNIGGQATYDGTVGLEVVSDVLDIHDATNWYHDVLEYIYDEYGRAYQPTGLMRGGSTAGMHVHISSLTRDQARQLHDISNTPWAKVLFCSSIANDDDSATWPVFRGGRYCRTDNFSSGRYDCVNERGNGHYEWRMPEPMVPEHMEILVRFLTLFDEDPELATQYAQELLDEGDDRITSIRRAEATGMDIENIPTINREPAPTDPAGFFSYVNEAWDLPQIYTVEHEGSYYYVFETELGVDITVNDYGIGIGADTVIHADTISSVNDEQLADDILRAFNRRNSSQQRHTEATDELKKVIKKKKGKA